MAMDQVPDMMRSVGVGVVSHSEEGYRQTLQLLKLLFTWRPTQVLITSMNHAGSCHNYGVLIIACAIATGDSPVYGQSWQLARGILHFAKVRQGS